MRKLHAQCAVPLTSLLVFRPWIFTNWISAVFIAEEQGDIDYFELQECINEARHIDRTIEMVKDLRG